MVRLLDINLLIALAWPSHVHHHQAHIWFGRAVKHGWATCPLTQCGFVRVSSNPRIIPEAVTPREALSVLRDMLSHPHHAFWPDDIAMTDSHILTDLLLGHRQVTDAYLLGLALRHGGKLATLDHGILSLIPSKSPARTGLEIVSG